MSGLIGKTIGQYQIVEHLGKGGMAEVYKAYQPALDRYVAVKVLHPIVATDDQFLTRFQREARSVATLRHQHIVQIFDFGSEGKTYFMVMEFVDGQTLKQKLNGLRAEGQVMPLEEVRKLIQQVAQALDYAHERGLIHRDIKPANILLTSEGDAVLSDFGIARMIESTRQTMTGVVGTPEYMSPEQGQGHELDLRSDIYSLGVVLYEMLTGMMPYQADTPLAIIFKHVRDPLPLPRLINPDIPEPVELVTLKTLAKSPDGRHGSAGEMAAALTSAVRGEPLPEKVHDRPTEVVAPPAEAPTPRAEAAAPKRRRSWGCIVGVVIALLVVGGLTAAGVIFGPQLLSNVGSETETPTPTQRTATIAEADKGVEARSRSDGQWAPAHAGKTLQSGSAIRVPQAAFARLSFDEAILRLGPESELSINGILGQDQSRIVRLTLVRGRAWIQLNDESEFSVALPGGKVAVQGGRCGILLDDDGSGLVSVDIGQVAVNDVALESEQQVALSATGAVGEIGDMSEEERAAWQSYAVGPELALATPTATATATGTPTNTPTPTNTSTPTHTATSTTTPTATSTATATSTPTDTPIPTDTPTSAPTPTHTPPPTPTRKPTSTPTVTATPTVTPTYAPLGTFYWDSQSSEVGDGQHWQVYVYFHITGGDGNYTFYNGDELLGSGPEYTLQYGCGFPMIGKFIVVSGDGQRTEKDYYFEDVPCTPQG